MSSMMSPQSKDERFGSDSEVVSDFRQRRALEELERAEQKRLDQADQYSEQSSAEQRIRAWEKVHHLRMPSDPAHPVLSVIARATQLTLADVRNEQRLRASRAAPGGN
jgi:hypothetical protein